MQEITISPTTFYFFYEVFTLVPFLGPSLDILRSWAVFLDVPMFEETEESSNSDFTVYLGIVSASKIRQVARSLAESGR